MLQRNIDDNIGGAHMRSRVFCCGAALDGRLTDNSLIDLAKFFATLPLVGGACRWSAMFGRAVPW